MPTSIYIHIPFCRHRCAYCDFNTYAGMEALVAPYMAALQREIRVFEGRETGPVGTVFYGGGTPSLVPVAMLAETLALIREIFDLEAGAEITLEANPGTVSPDYLAELRDTGVNRLSMGMQSASPEDLRILEREHDFFDVIEAVRWARRAGFDNVNLDLIFGLPYQRFESWVHTLELAVGLQPDHLSVYNLILEHGTPMNAWVGRGLLPAPDDDLAADMYEHARTYLPAQGFEQYEISNWARRDGDERLLSCRHNLQYWRGLPYLGLGAGAHGYAGEVRTINARAPRAYIERLGAPGDPQRLPFPQTPATVNAAPVSRADAMGETMMMGLRLVREGVPDAGFRSRFGAGIEESFSDQTRWLIEAGLLEWAGGALRLTDRGVMLGNRVFAEFV